MSEARNEVHVVGRMGSRITSRELPSGDVITAFSVVVDRPKSAIHGTTKVDTIACQTSRPRLASTLSRIEPGTVIEVQGALRRRFWRAGAGLGSVMEVEAARVTALR
jgi:single-strand DNA-binding protein